MSTTIDAERDFLLTALGSAALPNDTINDLRAKFYANPPVRSGTGSPEGVVSAPVGTVYNDVAITNGASQWTKKTGSGNTGWVVTSGDTGWLNVATWDAAGVFSQGSLHSDWKPRTGNAGYLYLRRSNNTVYLSVTNIAVAVANGANGMISPIPAGFVAHIISSSAVARYSSANAPNLYYLTSSLGRGSNIGTALDDYIVQATAYWQTKDQWPTALPGPVVP